MSNLALLTDSYKLSQWVQYPEGSEYVYSYLMPRGGEFTEVVANACLQGLIKTYLLDPVTMQDVEEAREIAAAHFGRDDIFNYDGWKYVVEQHGGLLPLRIKAIPEGTVVSVKTVLATVENTDPKCYWLTNYMETLLMHVWYPTTVATISREFKKLIKASLEKTGDVAGLSFKLHDFGERGVSSMESAAIGGAAHLFNFMGTDTLPGVMYLRKHYAAPMAGFSIAATEHSTVTSWGQAHELDMLLNFLRRNPKGLAACVGDSYDIIHFCKEIVGHGAKDVILNREGTFVVRPDSGEPNLMIVKVLKALGDAFGTTTNDKGYKVLPPQVRVIYGDGIDLQEMKRIIYSMESDRWSMDNCAFGCGGGLLQKMNRDTCKFALKCSSITVNGVERDVFKDPVTDKSKASLKGRLKVCKAPNGMYLNFRVNDPLAPFPDELRTVFENGKLLIDETLDTIRERASL